MCSFSITFIIKKSSWSIFHLAHSTPLPLQTQKGGSRKRTGGVFALTIHKSKSSLVGRVAGKTILIFCTFPASKLWSGPDRRRGPNGQTYAPISAQIDRCKLIDYQNVRDAWHMDNLGARKIDFANSFDCFGLWI